MCLFFHARKETEHMKVSLKALRVNSTLTIEEASKKLGIGKETLRNYEKGKTSPDQITLERILDLYQADYENVVFRYIPKK